MKIWSETFIGILANQIKYFIEQRCHSERPNIFAVVATATAVRIKCATLTNTEDIHMLCRIVMLVALAFNRKITFSFSL